MDDVFDDFSIFPDFTRFYFQLKNSIHKKQKKTMFAYDL